jgi:hypothetical protein
MLGVTGNFPSVAAKKPLTSAERWRRGKSLVIIDYNERT